MTQFGLICSLPVWTREIIVCFINRHAYRSAERFIHTSSYKWNHSVSFAIFLLVHARIPLSAPEQVVRQLGQFSGGILLQAQKNKNKTWNSFAYQLFADIPFWFSYNLLPYTKLRRTWINFDNEPRLTALIYITKNQGCHSYFMHNWNIV